MPTPETIGTLHTTLIDWYHRNARTLPWRRHDRTPWEVMVSEFMLQQTPVARVLPVWEQWMHRWPTPQALAAEPRGEAVRAWGRLGYPRRALRLHAAASAITAEHAGSEHIGAVGTDPAIDEGRLRRGADHICLGSAGACQQSSNNKVAN